MNNIFQKSRSAWVRYDSYEIKKDEVCTRYLTPAKDAKPHVYNPMDCAQELVVDALNVGRLMMIGKKSWDPEVETAILEFASKYGLLGFMSGLPTTPDYLDYFYAYFPKNQFVRDDYIESICYTSKFFPFDELTRNKSAIVTSWNYESDKDMLGLMLTFENEPKAVGLSMQRQYCEQYEWYAMQLKNYAFTFFNSFFYYSDHDRSSDEAKVMLRKSMKAFGGIAPSYHIELHDKPVLYWDFYSLMNEIEMMLSLMIVDEENPLRMCKHCGKVFLSTRSNAAFCSPACKNRYNVYKSRERKELEDE